MAADIENTSKLDVEISADILNTIVGPSVEIAVDSLANFRWREESLKVRTVDASNAIVVDQEVQQSAFDKYDVEPENDEIVFGTRCRTISTLLNAARANESISLTLNRQNRLRIQFSDVDYQLSGVNPEGIDEPNLPDLNYEVHATVHSDVFQRVNQVIGMMSETVRFEISEDQFRLSGRGDTDIAEIDVALVPNEQAILDQERKCAAIIENISEEVEASYGTEFIQYLNSFTPSKCLKLNMGEDYPLHIIAERGHGHIPTDIFIAPRMSDA